MLRRWTKGRIESGAAALLIVAGLVLMTAMAVGAQAPKPLAEVNGEVIGADEVEKPLAVQLGKLQEQIYTLKRQRVESIVRQKLLEQEAARRGLTVPKLLDADVNAKVGLVSEEEVEKFYQANKARLGADETAAREQARNQLQNSKLSTAREAFIRALRDKAKVAIHLTPPPLTRVAVSTDGAPVKGPAMAPVTIVEFSDFHCPFCKRVNPTLDQVVAQYGDRVRIVFRDYPIDQLHPGARKAHEAARCAHEQGKFWAYHDVVFDKAPRASADDLKTYAKQVGLDLAAFDTCVASGKHVAAVKKDVEEGAQAGVIGTPAFFINGRVLSGAQALEAFAQVIDDELARGVKR
jgi:protein-disulfide isomerase